MISLWNHLCALECSRVWGFVSMFVYICEGFSHHWFSGFTALWAQEESLCYFNSYFNLVRLVLWKLRAQLGIGFFFGKKLLITDSISLLFTRLFFSDFSWIMSTLKKFMVCKILLYLIDRQYLSSVLLVFLSLETEPQSAI